MITVSAPDGYEGSRCFIDAAREWRASYRRVGATWWTTCGYIGHAHLMDGELDSRASAAIARHIEIHGGLPG